MHLPLFVLLSVLLEDKKRFKHGGVISVEFAWVLAFGIHSWGFIYLILWFTTLFSLLCLVFACFGFDFLLKPFKPKCINKTMISEALKINAASKIDPRHPTMTEPWQIPQSRAKHQNAALEKWQSDHDRGYHRLPMVFTMV